MQGVGCRVRGVECSVQSLGFGAEGVVRVQRREDEVGQEARAIPAVHVRGAWDCFGGAVE